MDIVLLGLPFFMIIVGFFVCYYKHDHLMGVLISMEFISLGLFYFIFMTCMVSGLELFQTLIFLVAAVCEGSLGLAVLVSMIRTHGSDYVSCMNFL